MSASNLCLYVCMYAYIKLVVIFKCNQQMELLSNLFFFIFLPTESESEGEEG